MAGQGRDCGSWALRRSQGSDRTGAELDVIPLVAERQYIHLNRQGAEQLFSAEAVRGPVPPRDAPVQVKDINKSERLNRQLRPDRGGTRDYRQWGSSQSRLAPAACPDSGKPGPTRAGPPGRLWPIERRAGPRQRWMPISVRHCRPWHLRAGLPTTSGPCWARAPAGRSTGRGLTGLRSRLSVPDAHREQELHRCRNQPSGGHG